MIGYSDNAVWQSGNSKISVTVSLPEADLSNPDNYIAMEVYGTKDGVASQIAGMTWKGGGKDMAGNPAGIPQIGVSVKNGVSFDSIQAIISDYYSGFSTAPVVALS